MDPAWEHWRTVCILKMGLRAGPQACSLQWWKGLLHGLWNLLQSQITEMARCLGDFSSVWIIPSSAAESIQNFTQKILNKQVH